MVQSVLAGRGLGSTGVSCDRMEGRSSHRSAVSPRLVGPRLCLLPRSPPPHMSRQTKCLTLYLPPPAVMSARVIALTGGLISGQLQGRTAPSHHPEASLGHVLINRCHVY
ncbi:unnamed protein product [Gadus morhua 'NCC']